MRGSRHIIIDVSTPGCELVHDNAPSSSWLDLLNLSQELEASISILRPDYDTTASEATSDKELCKILAESSNAPISTIDRVFDNESCSCSMNRCLRNAVLASIDTEDLVIVVLHRAINPCLALSADLIFATGPALKMCAEQSLPHHPITRLSDCSRILRSLQRQRRLSVRRQARLSRMDAIKTE